MNEPTTSKPKAAGFSVNRILLLVLPIAALLFITWLGFGVFDGMSMLTTMRPGKLAPASGTVMFNDEPLKEGTIFFQPGDTNLIESIGTVKDGKFTMMTDIKGAYQEGAFVGAHRVRIEAVGAVVPGAGPPLLTPRKYASFRDSGLTAEVTEEGPNEFAFVMQGEAGGMNAPPPPGGGGGGGGGGGRGGAGGGRGGSPPDPEAMVNRLLEEHDQDGDGVLSADEIAAIEGMAANFIPRADQDGDGAVTRQELETMAQGMGGERGGRGGASSDPPQDKEAAKSATPDDNTSNKQQP